MARAVGAEEWRRLYRRRSLEKEALSVIIANTFAYRRLPGLLGCSLRRIRLKTSVLRLHLCKTKNMQTLELKIFRQQRLRFRYYEAYIACERRLPHVGKICDTYQGICACLKYGYLFLKRDTSILVISVVFVQ